MVCSFQFLREIHIDIITEPQRKDLACLLTFRDYNSIGDVVDVVGK